jgi:adenylate kinase family enzyme
MKVLVFGNSGSGKSTYARALAAREGLAHLELDSIVWEPGKIAVQRSTESVIADLRSFLDSRPAWVIEGCYGDLVKAASAHCTLMVFLNPGVEACLANNAARPWESHKYASQEEQDHA